MFFLKNTHDVKLFGPLPLQTTAIDSPSAGELRGKTIVEIDAGTGKPKTADIAQLISAACGGGATRYCR